MARIDILRKGSPNRTTMRAFVLSELGATMVWPHPEHTFHASTEYIFHTFSFNEFIYFWFAHRSSDSLRSRCVVRRLTPSIHLFDFPLARWVHYTRPVCVSDPISYMTFSSQCQAMFHRLGMEYWSKGRCLHMDVLRGKTPQKHCTPVRWFFTNAN